jgi:hypothetical protein
MDSAENEKNKKLNYLNSQIPVFNLEILIGFEINYWS